MRIKKVRHKIYCTDTEYGWLKAFLKVLRSQGKTLKGIGNESAQEEQSKFSRAELLLFELMWEIVHTQEK